MYYSSVTTKLGKVFIGEKEGKISIVSFRKSEVEGYKKDDSSNVLKKAGSQLKEYFAGERDRFDLPLDLSRGTPFQQKVWKELCRIPYGKTVSYGAVAQKLGDKNKARAVGMANNKNPLGIIIPCHRVIGASGDLTGYAGGISYKEKLLKLEKQAN